ncbi:MAG: hypothetical protein WD396_10505, partial [Pseudohongiellaceae bacterium]
SDSLMRGLAEYVMAGRRQAIITVVLLGLVPLVNLLSPVAVGLVMLRKGPREALIVLAWAILPLVGWAILGDVVPLILVFGIGGLAWLLRETESWEFTLLAAIVVGVGVELWFRIQPAVLDTLFQQLEAYLASNQVQEVQMEQVRAVLPSIIGSVYMFLAVSLLILTRWLQAALYNPGGFRKEFHSLRIEQKVALVLIVLMLLASFGIIVPESWVMYFVIPLLVAGVALVHGMVGLRELSSMWLVAFYALLMLPIVVQMVVLAALVDSWYDFRGRVAGS